MEENAIGKAVEIEGLIKFPEDHVLNYEDGVFSIATKEFHEKLKRFLIRFSEIQLKEKHYQLPFELYNQFPDVEIDELRSETFTRKQDLAILKTHFPDHFKTGKTALEIGGWNGWLTNRLAATGIKTVSVDIFNDERNGLKSRKHYKTANWISLQTDIVNTGIYKATFDLIIFNHCLQFLTEPLALAEKYKSLLSKNGILIILGGTYYKNTAAKTASVLKTTQHYKNNYQFDLHFYPSKGYFSYEDHQLFLKNSFKFISYKFSLLGNLRKWLKQEKSGILYYTNT